MKKSFIFTIVGSAVLVVFISSFFFSGGIFDLPIFKENMRNLAIVICVIVILLPAIIENNFYLRREEEKEEKFLEFLRDVLENIKSGTPITKSILNVQYRDYGVLSVYIKKLANQISLGFPLNEALENFSKEVNNEIVARTVDLISEANRSGGEIANILSSITESINQIEIIKKERKSSVNNLLIQGYIIFVVFMIIVLILDFFLIPKLMKVTKSEEELLEINTIKDLNFSRIIVITIIVEAIFSGLVIGKISGGSIKNGIKHSFILSSFSLFVFFLAKVLFSK